MATDPIIAPDPQHDEWMSAALDQARLAAAHDDIPIGAVVVHRADDGTHRVVAARHNERELADDPTAHAEVLALRDAAAALGRWRLDDCLLVVTLEPCPMCAGALMLARIERVVFGAWDPKAGACGSVWDIPRDRRATHRCEVIGGVREPECAQLLLDFFAGHRL